VEHRRIPKWIASEVEKLYRSEYSALLNHARLLTQGDHDAAEDLVHEVFEAVASKWRAVPLCEEQRRPWLFAVLRNKAMDRWRSREPQPLPQPELLGTEEAYVADHDDSPELPVNPNTIEQLWKEMKSMSTAQYRVAYLDWVCGLSTREIADTLGIAQSTVRVHRHNAAKQLRNMLAVYRDATDHPQDPISRKTNQTEGW
jgi:RNA polymerase sigma-70 factor, ECF subfamily